MRFVNGNTTVYGGVYIVGQPDENEDEPLVFESNGNFSIFNGYDKSGDSSNAAYLVDGARSASNLCAALRVQRGKVAVGGSTQLGQPNNKLITVAVSDGADDIILERGGTENCLNNKGICTEIGPKPFDIESPPAFPLLDEPAPSTLCETDSWRECIREEAVADGMIIVNTGSGVSVQVGNETSVALESTCSNALNGAYASASLAFTNTTIDCRFTDGSGRVHGFYYNAATEPETLQVFGNLNFRGFDLEFSRATQYQAQSRDDTGTVQEYAGLSVETNEQGGGSMFAADHFVADQTLGKFPDNVLSIIAELDVDFYGNQRIYTAPVYAQSQFRLRGNAQLFGQVIANQFCSTNGRESCSIAGNPSEIVYVPTGGNRAKSFKAIAPTGGIPTFETMAYELR